MSEIDELHQTISRVEEEIRVRLQYLLELKQRRNRLVPVARLPPELLSDIFLRLRDGHIQTLDRGISSLKGSWIAVSHVSHAWRQNALATPLLWAYIDLRCSAASHEYIKRSRRIPLRLFMSQSDDTVTPTGHLLDTVRSYPGGISSLSLEGKYTVITLCLPLGCCSADHLRVLELGYLGDAISYELPDHILDLQFPKMETLTLVDCVLDQNCVLLPSRALSLRHLHLRSCLPKAGATEIRTHHALIQIMFNTLESLQFLETLLLDRCMHGAFNYSSMPDLDVPGLHLPALKSLCVSEGFHAVAAISRAIRIPEGCRTQIQATHSRFLTTKLIQDLFAAISSPHPLILYFKITQTGLRICSSSKGNQLPLRSLTLFGAHWCANREVLAEIAKRISVRATVICLHVELPVKLEEWLALRTLCGGAEAVATNFRLTGTPDVLAVVAECMADRTGFLPRLRHVSFCRNFDMSTADGAALEKWAGALIERKKAGATIGVALSTCSGISQDIRDKLKENLDWVR